MISERRKLDELELEIQALRSQRDLMASQIAGLHQTQGQRRVSKLSSDPGFDPLGLNIKTLGKRIDITQRRVSGFTKIDTARAVRDRMTEKQGDFGADVINHAVSQIREWITKRPHLFLKTTHDQLHNMTYVAVEMYLLTSDDVGQERSLLIEGRTMQEEIYPEPGVLKVRYDRENYGTIGIDKYVKEP